MRSKPYRNQLSLLHGTKTKPDMLKNGEQPESIVSDKFVGVTFSVSPEFCDLLTSGDLINGPVCTDHT